MSGLYIASRRVDHDEHDGSRRVVAAASLIGDRVRAAGEGEVADDLAAALLAGRLRRELDDAGIEAVKRAGREAWRIHHEQRGEAP